MKVVFTGSKVEEMRLMFFMNIERDNTPGRILRKIHNLLFSYGENQREIIKLV